ncbi:hypothetical protein UZ36_02335 [Candidatus Nitromaritima sp. SCGC AAA799-C22]|nr:hypothetical protein UZ36_02335 [Candidatus Nitromaritima sp. SCGC AAA799-C22]
MVIEANHKLDLLDKIPFFDLFDEIEKQVLIRETTCFQNYQTNEGIIFDGHKDDTLFVLLKGKVVVAKGASRGTGKEVILAQLQIGDIFGELSLLLRRPRTTSISAKSEVVVWKIDAKTLEHMDLGIQNKIQFKIVQLMVKRLDDMNKKFIKAVQEKTLEQTIQEKTLEQVEQESTPPPGK